MQANKYQLNDIGDNMIVYCSECDKYKISECDYLCEECGEIMIELMEDDLLIKLEEMQKEVEELT